MYVAIKIKDQKEYKEAEKLLIEKGFHSDEEYNYFQYEEMKDYENVMHFIVIYEDKEFCLYVHDGGAKVYENISEFLTIL